MASCSSALPALPHSETGYQTCSPERNPPAVCGFGEPEIKHHRPKQTLMKREYCAVCEASHQNVEIAIVKEEELVLLHLSSSSFLHRYNLLGC